MRADFPDRGLPSISERLGMGLILLSGITLLLRMVQPESMGMAPLIGGVLLLLISRLPQQPLATGWLVLLLLNLRMTLRGGDLYLSREITLDDALMVLIAAASCFMVGLRFWAAFQTLFCTAIPAAGIGAWIQQVLSGSAGPLAAGSLTAAQSSMLFGLCLSLTLPRLIAMSRGNHHTLPSWGWQPRLGWTLASLVSAALTVASGGIAVLALAAIAVLTVQLTPWCQSAFPGWSRPLRGGLLAGLVIAASTAGALLASPSTLTPFGTADMTERVGVLRCFFTASFSSVERFFLGVGFTNSSDWLCRHAAPGTSMIQANNLLAQIAADNGVIALGGISALIIGMACHGDRLIQRRQDLVIMSGLSAGLFCLLDVQTHNGWAQSSLLQVLLGLQVGFLSLRLEDS
jgi:hypothetical protein